MKSGDLNMLSLNLAYLSMAAWYIWLAMNHRADLDDFFILLILGLVVAGVNQVYKAMTNSSDQKDK